MSGLDNLSTSKRLQLQVDYTCLNECIYTYIIVCKHVACRT